MKKLLLIIPLILLTFSSCELETSDNGDLDGFWHLEGIDSLATSVHQNVSEQKLFWAFQMDLLQLRGSEQEFYLRFNHEGNCLDLFNPHLRDREKDDPVLTDKDMYLILPYGINATEERFQVLKLNSREMVLQNAILKLSFRRF